MSKLAFGIYEHIINEIINESLSKFDKGSTLKETEALDEAESSIVLAEYLANILKEVLDYVEDTKTSVRDRVALCNSVIDHIIYSIENGKFNFKSDENVIKRLKGLLIHTK